MVRLLREQQTRALIVTLGMNAHLQMLSRSMEDIALMRPALSLASIRFPTSTLVGGQLLDLLGLFATSHIAWSDADATEQATCPSSSLLRNRQQRACRWRPIVKLSAASESGNQAVRGKSSSARKLPQTLGAVTACHCRSSAKRRGLNAGVS